MMASLFCALLGFSSPASALAPGAPAPDFAAKNQSGKLVRLSDFKGKYVLLYFYPKDDTPGCTKEAKNFQSDLDKFSGLNAVVLGVSAQDESSHQKFIAKYGLKFDLLVDSEGAIRKAFGVGSIPILGLSKRQSVLIGPDGRVVRFYDSVNPSEHTQEVLEDLKKAERK